MKRRADGSLDKQRREFGEWFRRQRLQANHSSQKAFAGLLEIDPVQLNRIENGASGISPQTLDRAIAILKLDAFDAYKRAGLLPKEVQMSKEDEVAEQEAEALRTAKLIQNWNAMSPEEQARALAVIEVLRAKHPKALDILGPSFKVTTTKDIDLSQPHVKEEKKK